jgi:hypothetical protein
VLADTLFLKSCVFSFQRVEQVEYALDSESDAQETSQIQALKIRQDVGTVLREWDQYPNDLALAMPKMMTGL